MAQRLNRSVGNGGGEAASWIPPVDIYETEDSYVLTAELPGVDQPDVKIEVAGSELTMRGERRYQPPCTEENYHRLETARGKFLRTFSLPEKVNSEAITANLKDGVLEVRLPKAAAGRTISIQSGSAANR
jgi:HSP20 family protein